MDRILGFDAQTIIQMGIMLFNILLTVYIMQWLLYKPVSKYLAKRAEKIENQLQDANNAKTESEALQLQYENYLENIENERTQILATANKRAKEREAQIMIEAKNEADIIKSRALLDIEMEQAKAKENVKKEIIEISNLIAGKYVTKAMDVETQNKFFDQAISEMGEMKWQS